LEWNSDMKLYAVRIIEERWPVGFFWVRDLEQLIFCVDDICQPADCEYKPIHQVGGIVWPDHGEIAWQMGVKTSCDDLSTEVSHFQRVKAGLGFYGALEDLICGIEVRGWKRIPPSITPPDDPAD
jgi:hypothetical protein